MRRLWTGGRVHAQHGLEQRHHRFGNTSGTQLLDGQLLALPRPYLVQSVRRKRRAPSECVPHRRSQRINIRTLINAVIHVIKLFRTGEGRRADKALSRLGGNGWLRALGHRFGQTEVDELDQHRTSSRPAFPFLSGEHEIGRLEVAMDHAALFGRR
jgi:hypothetical protein